MTPKDQQLYNKTKKQIYNKYPKHSAYRSGILVQKYKQNFTKKYGKLASPYIGKKNKKVGLSRWFDEKWLNQRSEVGYKFKNDIYRPKIRITDDTPITHDELTEKEIDNARVKKYRKGRVNRFQKLGKTGGHINWTLKYKNGKNKTKKQKRRFNDYPAFRPNLTPREMFKSGSFGGTYWRPINSAITGKNYKNKHLKYPESWWNGIPEEHLTKEWDDYDSTINKYGVKVGTTLEFWEEKEWINKMHPYGWVQWYCDFYSGKRGSDDERQIKRWVQTAGPNSRFRRALINLIKKKNAKYDDFSISPKIRQTLQHWGYRLIDGDCK
tara:strand:+ start:1544 stop:2515 length:972 start_codon:yes stop_codon:yes gene_type:complete